MKPNIFVLLSTCMEVSVSLSCLFVHEPLCQTPVVCCNSIFRHSSSHMDHCTVLYVRVGFAQDCSNNRIRNVCGMGSLVDKLYQLDCEPVSSEYASVASEQECDLDLWH